MEEGGKGQSSDPHVKSPPTTDRQEKEGQQQGGRPRGSDFVEKGGGLRERGKLEREESRFSLRSFRNWGEASLRTTHIARRNKRSQKPADRMGA